MAIGNWLLANSVWVAFGVTVVVLVYFIVKTVETFKKRRRNLTTLSLILLVWALLFFYYVLFVGSKIEPTDWGQIILLGGLVSITAAYAYSTEKMAQEMREQRLTEARPYLLLRLADEFVQLSGQELKVTIENVGKGPAKNLSVAFWNLEYDPIVTTKGYLGPNEDWDARVSMSVGMSNEGNLWLPELRVLVGRFKTIAIKYEDIHNRAWASYLCIEETDAPGYFMEANQNIVEVKNC